MREEKTFTLKELALLTGATLFGDPDYRIHHVANLEEAGAGELSFLANRRYLAQLPKSKAGAICVEESFSPIAGRNFLLTKNPSGAFQSIAELFYPQEQYQTGFTGIHPTACIHREAMIANHVSIGPYAVIDRGAQIATGCQIGAHCFIGAGSTLAKDCLLHPHVTLRENCHLGARVVLQPGAVIGSCGFGYLTDEKCKHQKMRQMGSVIIEEDVEIGSNSCIDRARFSQTHIKKGSKLDNLVQVAHNVELGEDNLIVSQAGIAGSTKTGNRVILGGQVGVVGHVTLCDDVIVAARGAVIKSTTEPGIYSGAPVQPLQETNRQHVYLRNIEKYVKKLEALEKRLALLEEKV